MSTAPTPPGVEVWRGGVNAWECDHMGHMNVRFYVARATEGLAGFAAQFGLANAFGRRAASTLLVKDQHIRFMREARPAAALHMTAGVLEVTDTEARILQLLFHSTSGELAASFQTLVAHVTVSDRRPFAWPSRIRANLAAMEVDVPADAAPRSLSLDPSDGGGSLSAAQALGLMPIAAGTVGVQDCDVFGRMRPEAFVGRISEGVSGLRSRLNGEAPNLSGQEGLGGAVLEYRLAYFAYPEAGSRLEVRSGLAGVDEKAQRFVHWILDPANGRPWASAEAVAVNLDLEQRKVVPFSAERRAHLEAQVVAGLQF